MVFIPFPYQVFLFYNDFIQKSVGAFLFKVVDSWGYFDFIVPEIQSDSILLYALCLFLLLFSICINVVIGKKVSRFIQTSYFTYLLHFYIALHLLKYGFSKVLLQQFHNPAPNILATPLGKLDQDILYWSVIGSNPPYQIFLGVVEVFIATLLLFKRTQKIGLYAALVVLIHILAINFFYDISVKLFSSFLTVTCLYLLAPHLQNDFSHLFLSKIEVDVKNVLLGLGIGSFLFIECIYLQLPTKEENQLFNEVYRVENSPQIKRVFFHKDHYLIFQLHNEEMIDYKYSLDEPKNLLILTDYNLAEQLMKYKITKDTLYLSTSQSTLICYKDTINTNALQPNFHWTVEGVR